MSDTAVVEWSRNAGERAFCDVCHETVFDAWHHAGIYYLLTATKCDAGVPSTESRNRVQAWDSSGERLWVSEVLNDEQATGGRICSDGTDVWVTVGGATPFVYRLDALDGDVLYSSIEFTYAINYLCPDGAGSVWLAHDHQSDGDGDGFVSLWADGVFSDRFGGNATATAYSIDIDGSTLYIGHNLYTTTEFAAEYCTPCGFVSRYDEGVLTWISCGRISNLSPYTDPPSTFPLHPLVAFDSGAVYFAFKDGSGYGSMEPVAGKPTWIREIDRSILIDTPCTGRYEPIADFDASGGTLWIAVNRWLYQLDSSGTVLDSVTHTSLDYGTCNLVSVFTVTADGSGGALLGGVSAPCENPANESQDSTAVEGAECDDNGTDANWCSAFDWDEVNDCGSLTTTGRLRVGGCSLAQAPPCEGPVVVNYTCGETTVNETVETIGGPEQCDGTIAWSGSGETVSIVIRILCDGTAEVDLEIDGCTITGTTATLNCEGPFGYASVDFTFTGTCDGCDLNGCGVFNGEDCETLISTDCCEGVPTELPVTMTSGVCAYANGVTGTATWNATLGEWECVLTLTTAVGDKTWGFAFFCPMAGGAPTDFTIRGLDAMSALSADCEPNMDYTASMGATCSPLSVTFSNVQFTGASACCDDGTPMPPAATATIVIG